MALLDSLFGSGDQNPAPPPPETQPTNGFTGGIMRPSFADSAAPLLSAVGMSLLTSSRFNPLGNVPVFLKQAEDQRTQAASRGALVAVLKQAGFSDQEAQAYALNPKAAELAIATRSTARGQAADKAALGILGSDLTSGASPAAPGGPASGASLSGSALAPPTGDSAAIQTKFVDSLRAGGLTNPYGLGAVAAYGQHESQYAPGNVNRSWSDPSERGAAGTSGGILSWRNERLENMRAATAGAKDPVVAQAQFLLNENPELTAKLQNAKSAEEANALMADAWQFAGYNRRDGGEYARRLATTQSYANQFGQPQRTQVASASGAVPTTMPPGASGLNPGQRVDVAENEQDVQRLEGKLNQYPSNVYGITRPSPPQGTAVAAADLPAPGAQEAGFRIPGEGGSTGGDAPTIYNDKATAMRALGKINQALAVSGITDDTRRILESRRQEALAVLKPTDTQQKLAEMGLRPGTAEYQEAARRMAFGDKGGDKITAEAQQRAQIASQYGLVEGTPEFRTFALTGRLPKDEDKPLSAGDKKAIYDAENQLAPIASTLDTLRRAKELNPQTYTGVTAGYIGTYGTSVPGAGFVIDQKKAGATREFNQLMSLEAIKSMSQTLKGATTDREMSRFMEILGDPSTPPDIRGRTIDRLIKLSEQQLELQQDRVSSLRGGTYFDPNRGGAPSRGQSVSPSRDGQGGRPAQVQAAPPPAAIQALRSDARLRDQFDAKYGAGAAAQALGER